MYHNIPRLRGFICIYLAVPEQDSYRLGLSGGDEEIRRSSEVIRLSGILKAWASTLHHILHTTAIVAGVAR